MREPIKREHNDENMQIIENAEQMKEYLTPDELASIQNVVYEHKSPQRRR